jgi:arylsulfatase A-like enzyme
MYSDFDFQVPQTAIAGFKKTPALPPYIFPRYNITEANDNIQHLGSEIRRDWFRRIFGMIKLIDDNVGKMMTYLKNAGLDENTIVVFTSDHGK